MPIYDYRCDHCGHVFSVVQSYKDEALAACPVCGRRPRRLITTPAIVFKGSGWYKTDSRASSPAAKESAAKDAPAKDTAAKDTAAKDTAAKDGSGSGGESAEKKASAKAGEKGSAPAGGG